MMWNVQRSDLETCPDECVHMCVCMYVKTLENLRFCISGIYAPIELKFGAHLKDEL